MKLMLTPGASNLVARPRAVSSAATSLPMAHVRPAPASRAVTRPAAMPSAPAGRDLLPKGRKLQGLRPLQASGNGNGNGNGNGSGVQTINRQPTKAVLDVLQQANAVCFDVDHTITINDTLDLLAEFMGVGQQVADLTNKAMDGTMNLEESLEERLKIINCKPADIKAFLQAHPPETRLTKGIKSLIKNLQARGVSVYLITGGFRELAMPIADCLDIPRERVFANRMLWQWDDETMEPTRLVGFDMSEPTARNQGKPQAIAMIREQNPYQSVVMIGDGITDLEAVQVSGGADLFIGYGGAAERSAVQAGADWYVYDWSEVESVLKRYKVALIGSGAWACAAARMVAQNCKEDPSDEFDETVRMWVHEEELGGRKLSEIINEVHENPMYLPGIALPENVEASGDIAKTVQDADMLIFCTPHQYIRGICKQLVGKVKPGAIAISLIKGMSVRKDGPQLISKMVSRSLGIDCCVLMGANLAEGIAREELSEAVIGYNNLENARAFKKIFERPYFTVSLLPDAPGAEMCGTLKNIVALAAGLVDGLGYGPNSKAAMLRQGLSEMMRFSQALYPTVRDETFMESCGVADLVATCYGGRNLRVSRAYAEAWKAGTPLTFATLEARLLNGERLQGVQTSDEVQEILRTRGWEKDYPLFTTVNRIIHQQLDPTYIVKYVQGANKYIPQPSDTPEEEPKPAAAEPSAPKKPRFAPLHLTL